MSAGGRALHETLALALADSNPEDSDPPPYHPIHQDHPAHGAQVFRNIETLSLVPLTLEVGPHMGGP